MSADAQRAFDRGDYQEARRLATLTATNDNEAAAAAAQFLLQRLRPDPVVWWLTACGVALLAAAAFF